MAKPGLKKRREGGRTGNIERRRKLAVNQMPWRLPVNRDKPTEPLSEEGVHALHDGAMRVLEEIGVAFLNKKARDILKKSGCIVDGDIVRMDREFVLEMVSKSPSEWSITPRNFDRRITVGGNHIVFGNVSSPPSYWDYSNQKKVSGSREMCKNLLKLSQYLLH